MFPLLNGYVADWSILEYIANEFRMKSATHTSMAILHVHHNYIYLDVTYDLTLSNISRG